MLVPALLPGTVPPDPLAPRSYSDPDAKSRSCFPLPALPPEAQAAPKITPTEKSDRSLQVVQFKNTLPMKVSLTCLTLLLGGAADGQSLPSSQLEGLGNRAVKESSQGSSRCSGERVSSTSPQSSLPALMRSLARVFAPPSHREPIPDGLACLLATSQLQVNLRLSGFPGQDLSVPDF